MTQEVLNFYNIQVCRQQRRILSIDDLVVKAGELVAVIGPNGSGKSTLLQVINTLLPYNSGTLRVFGDNAQSADKRELRLKCAFVFQDHMVLRDTVYNNVALPLLFRGIEAREIELRVAEMLELFQCAHLAGRLADQLSGGEAQRVCLARAMVSNPELLLLDEPFAALDPSTRATLLSELRQLAVQRGMTVMLVSHHFNEVLDFAERAIVLMDGYILQDDSPEGILRRPVNETVARLIGVDNIFSCQLEMTDARSVLHLPNDVRIPWSGDATGNRLCCLPGDAIDIYPAERWVEKMDPGAMKGIVCRVSPGVGVYRVIVECGGVKLVARLNRERAEKLAAGDSVRVTISADEIHLC